MRAVLALLLLATPATAAPKTVKIKTDDGWTLTALWQPPAKNRPVAVLIHGVGAGKTEWDSFSAELAAKGFGTLAVDLRGHGESLQGPRGRQTYESFGRQDFARAQADVTAAMAFLRAKGIPTKKTGVIGGSLGANLAGKARDTAWAVLLSPGADYMGVVTFPEDWAGRKILLAASPPDKESFRACMGWATAQYGPIFLQGQTGHGVQLLNDKALKEKLLEWLAKTAN